MKRKRVLKKIGFRRRKYSCGKLQVKAYTKRNKVYLSRKIKRGCGIFTFVLKAFGEPLAKIFLGI